jgi:hypothetical protein
VMAKCTIDVHESFITSPERSAGRQPESSLYTDFYQDVRWIKQSVRADLETLPPPLQGVARYYLTERIKVLNTSEHACAPHPLSPRPIPYIAFWFADAFNIDDPQVRRLLGLCLCYACLSSTPRDDLLDGSRFAPRQQTYLSRWFWGRYISALQTLFAAESSVWQLLSKSTADWERSERWILCHAQYKAADPLSAASLRNSSAYLAALIFPTLAGVALLGNRSKEVSAIRRFVYYYCMGWRILDDWRDWREDLEADSDSSSVLVFLRSRAGISKRVPLTKQLVVSALSDQAVVRRIYSAMARFCLAARRESVNLNAVYVTRFIDEQLLGYEAELARMRAEKENFRKSLARLLESYAATSRAPRNKVS